MSNTVIKVENLSKQYRLGEIGTGSLAHDINRWWYKARGKEDPYLKIGEANDRTKAGTSEYVWSLRDVNFNIEQGDAVGIIGRNGAGKSTLLKILSQVTAPTTGSVKVKGRIASLLEVGTGFHPDLSGRDNIFLNGAILGMRKAEIKRKFDEIVDFAGVERYIDTPVKRYSSGMYVRLAFAVAAHLESEILIVDEVLAVGDAEFQKKCLGKMGDVSKGEGRTVLFVSHNMASIKQLCTRGIVLDKGNVVVVGNISESTSYYKNQSALNNNIDLIELIVKKHFSLEVNNIMVNNSTESRIELIENTLSIAILGICTSQFQYSVEIRVFSSDGVLVSFYSPGHINSEFKTAHMGAFRFEDSLTFPDNMANGEYSINIDLCYPNFETYLSIEGITLIKNTFTTASGRSLSYNDIGFFYIK